jgi:hypothetical protein
MAESQVLPKPDAVTEAGQQIYRERFQTEYGSSHRGKFLAIDVETGEATLADEAVDAMERAH